MTIPYAAEIAAATLANASVILLLVRSGPALGPAASGRRGTHCLQQLHTDQFAVQDDLLLGTMETLRPTRVLPVYLVVWGLNLVLSSLWLHVFAFGPLEWVWRSLTYWKRQPLLLREITS